MHMGLDFIIAVCRLKRMSGGDEHGGDGSSVRFTRMEEAFKKLLDKTFEEFTFEEFAAEFGREFSALHRDYLLDLYAQFVQTTRSNSELEFAEILFQSDLREKLAGLERLIDAQPEGAGGVALLDKAPAEMMRGVTMGLKAEERDRLAALLASLERDNDALRPQVEEQLSQVVAATSELQARKLACERMLVAASHA